eukprot:scpid47296/ scgid31324/ 
MHGCSVYTCWMYSMHQQASCCVYSMHQQASAATLSEPLRPANVCCAYGLAGTRAHEAVQLDGACVHPCSEYSLVLARVASKAPASVRQTTQCACKHCLARCCLINRLFMDVFFDQLLMQACKYLDSLSTLPVCRHVPLAYKQT